MKPSKKILLLSGILFLVSSVGARASTILFTTPTGATVGSPGEPVDASATIVTSLNTVTITLNDLLADPTDVGQLLSDFDFVLSNGATLGTLTSSSAQQITIVGKGDTTGTTGSTGSTGWGLNNSVGGGLQLDALGFSGPAGLIVGPGGAGGVYANANGSFNSSHNPFLNQTATYIISVAGVTDTTTVMSTKFSFGTTPGVEVTGVPVLPEPSSLLLLGTGIVGLAGIVRRRVMPATTRS